ncbi:MAG: enoyl-CoA hydratase/isomerase family protein [Saprospiraceae bacterium]|nr:enoyl-CoA hydratase/isomerase family protein [Saprospiraceae bacterium]
MIEDKTKQGSVEVNIENRIATIEFFHPSHNSLPGNLLAKLANAITEAGQNDEIVVIVLKSSGDRTFCAGASFDELIAIKDLESGHAFFMGFANVINACRKCPKIIIGRVQGKAVGGGVGVASAVDYCFATKYSSVKLSELAIGIGPFVVGPAVERKLGTSAFSQMAINATEWYSANWALQNGLFANVSDSAEDMDAQIKILSTRLAKSNPQAQTQLKKVFWEGTEHWDKLLAERASVSGTLVLSDFTVNAINSFKSK